MGKGHEYNLGLIEDAGATLANIVTITHLSYPQTKHYLQLLANQGLVTINIHHRKRKTRKKGRELKRQLRITTVKIADMGYKYLLKED
jgi:DNA-binding transcriptional regulator LsrR (DeoR family)